MMRPPAGATTPKHLDGSLLGGEHRPLWPRRLPPDSQLKFSEFPCLMCPSPARASAALHNAPRDAPPSAYVVSCPHPTPDYGFDPLRLGSKDKEVLKYYREAELTNGRWAMAAVAGILFTDLVRTCGGCWLQAAGAQGGACVST